MRVHARASMDVHGCSSKTVSSCPCVADEIAILPKVKTNCLSTRRSGSHPCSGVKCCHESKSLIDHLNRSFTFIITASDGMLTTASQEFPLQRLPLGLHVSLCFHLCPGLILNCSPSCCLCPGSSSSLGLAPRSQLCLRSPPLLLCCGLGCNLVLFGRSLLCHSQLFCLRVCRFVRPGLGLGLLLACQSDRFGCGLLLRLRLPRSGFPLGSGLLLGKGV
mmetsp:Transcript_30272/g.83517  ORF Transcript_30272/g.83517 Transcript_30272/m.83517 type:complete len:219 (+) Transcript_30272:16-672(+)